MAKITRRGLLVGSVLAAVALPAIAAEPQRKLKIVVVGGHPDDPESGAGGTMAMLAAAGHEVVALYLTRGEAGIANSPHDRSAQIRTAESEKACKILGARPVFAGQIDGATEINSRRYDEFAKLLLAEKPDIALTQWPIDTHRDHRAASLLTYDAWLEASRAFSLYYYEVMTGEQTQCFRPTDYIDISDFEAKKRQACFAHASQDPAGFYEIHSLMNRFRGTQKGCRFAEAFVREEQGKGPALPQRL